MIKSTQRNLTGLHWSLLVVVALIGLLGCYNLHSSAAHHDAGLYITQLQWLGLGALVAGLCLTVDYRVTETLAYPAYGFVVAMLVAVLAVGKSAMGAKRWLVLGPITFQPSEMAKIAIIFCLARYFSTRTLKEGYSIRDLARPLNITRPLACLALLAIAWDKPWLSDPMGQLARRVHERMVDGPPPIEDLIGFRMVLLSVIALTWGAGFWAIGRIERTVALLHPWPPLRRRRLRLGLTCVCAALLALLLWGWRAPGVMDPFGATLTALDAAARDGGAHAALRPTYGVRSLLAGLLTTYLMAALMHLRAMVRPTLAEVLVAPLDLLLVPALLVLVQPDLGTAGIIVAIGMTMIFVVGVQLRSQFIMGVLSTVVAFVAWFGVLKDYQKRRILTFIDPEQDIRGAGWNAVQSIIAVGSGKWLGKGHKNGTQTQLSFLPEQHTDFAFSVWGEEQGFVGCLALVLLYLTFVALALTLAARAREPYGVLLATGVTALIVWQAIINIGMVIGVLPVVGITLPLFSYGGSSVLTVMFGVGLLLNVHWRRR